MVEWVLTVLVRFTVENELPGVVKVVQVAHGALDLDWRIIER